jgi:SSS family transporter
MRLALLRHLWTQTDRRSASASVADRAGLKLAVAVLVACWFACGQLAAQDEVPQIAQSPLQWQALPDLPDELGVAGPFAGVHDDVLIVAGGANFAKPVWDNDKQWHDRIYVCQRQRDGDGWTYEWQSTGQLDRPIAYGASVSTPRGALCIGGNDAENTFDEVFLLSWDETEQTVRSTEMPALPKPCAYASAAIIGSTVYIGGGQTDAELSSASSEFWSLDLSQLDTNKAEWRTLPQFPGPDRAFHLTVSQHNGYHDCIYIISGRRQAEDEVQFLKDVWEFCPAESSWRPRREAPKCVMAGTSAAVGQSHVFVFGGADGSLFHRTNELLDDHPGFPKQAWAYHTITDRWVQAGETPANHVTTSAVWWGDRIVIPSGEVRPRVRSAKVYAIDVQPTEATFGTLNYGVLFGYLLAMVGVGVYFSRRNKNTDDYFRGGKQIPWWAAGCSIFATMLSSLTFTGIPSKAYAQDWVYAIGNMMIPVVAIVAVFVALPFFRRIDATSAYEYLERRFSRAVRLFGSASFTTFHIFRMAVVMSLTGLALAVATPLTPAQCVLLMGVLSIIYCTMGGIEAVIWTDTIQTVVLLGGAAIAIAMLISGVDGGVTGFWQAARSHEKLNVANLHWDVTRAEVALWVIVVGAIAQNLSSYTADQAVVQRYMTTADQKLAARSIWTNAVLTIPATVLFFGMGTALFAWYQSHPERLESTITTDQIFPLFIAREMPAGLAGLIVAGVFAAAQSTVSTSMNSTATTIVTDFLRPLQFCRSESGYLRSARISTFLIGVVGTVLGLVFVDPEIKSLFDAFIKVIGLFMGVLGGLFVLGALSTKASAKGALIGAFVGAAVMFCLWKFSAVNGYLYTASGITSCVVVGYLASRLLPATTQDLTGLTVYTLAAPEAADDH